MYLNSNLSEGHTQRAQDHTQPTRRAWAKPEIQIAHMRDAANGQTGTLDGILINIGNGPILGLAS